MKDVQAIKTRDAWDWKESGEMGDEFRRIPHGGM